MDRLARLAMDSARVGRCFPQVLSLSILLFLSVSSAVPATIAGTVVEYASGRPLARTRVFLTGRQDSGATPAHDLLSGSVGEFSVSGLPAGLYYLRAERRGYASYRHGQQSFDEPGTPIALTAEGEFRVQIRMRRLGVISGRVYDENQVGIEDIPVHAYRTGASWRALAATTTDDRGAYRISGLPPGNYVVRTAAKMIEGGVGLLPTYNGQVVAAAQTRAIEVQLDQEVTGVDIAPQPGRLGSLSGRLVGASAREVILVTEVGLRRTPVQPGARFDFGQVEPGRYRLIVDPEAAGGLLVAYRELMMGESDLEVSLPMEGAPHLTVACEAASTGPLDPRAVSIFARREDFGESTVRLACGESTVWGPGNWQIAVATPTSYYTAAIIEGERGAIHRLQVAPGDEQRLTILLSNRPATVSGTVRVGNDPAVGAPVFLTAYDEELRSRLGGVRSIRADLDGNYLFTGLPPGRYEVLSSYQVRDPDAAEWLGRGGTAVTVGENEEVILDIELKEVR